MLDELELVFDEDADRGRHRRRRNGRKKQKQNREKRGSGKTLMALFVVLLLLGGLAGGAWYGIDKVRGFFDAPDYSGEGAGQVQVEIKAGTVTDTANTLVKADVVKSAGAYIEAADAHPDGGKVQPGFYNLRKQMSAESALLMLLDLKNRVVRGVTIPEGKTAKQTFKLLSEKTKIPVKEFEAAAKNPEALGVPSFWFKRNDGVKVARSIEGFLFPQTYEFPPNATATDILKTMVQQFNTVVGESGFIKQVEGNLEISPFEALIVASLAQAEAGVPGDLGGIARVAYNRAYKKNMPLQFDVTANYWLDLQGKTGKHSGKLSREELNDPKNPYNTVRNVGLPIGPINSPGKAALDAAADPPKNEWLYFVAIDDTGKSAFAATLEEHDRNVQKACANGIPLC